MDEDYFSYKLNLEQQELYAQWKETYSAWKKAKAHAKWANKNQVSKDYEAIIDGGTLCGKTKKQLDKQFDKLPGQNDKA
jgi:hypothetical protein